MRVRLEAQEHLSDIDLHIPEAITQSLEQLHLGVAALGKAVGDRMEEVAQDGLVPISQSARPKDGGCVVGCLAIEEEALPVSARGHP